MAAEELLSREDWLDSSPHWEKIGPRAYANPELGITQRHVLFGHCQSPEQARANMLARFPDGTSLERIQPISGYAYFDVDGRYIAAVDRRTADKRALKRRLLWTGKSGPSAISKVELFKLLDEQYFSWYYTNRKIDHAALFEENKAIYNEIVSRLPLPPDTSQPD